MKARELREKTDAELAEMKRDLLRDRWNARFSNFTNQLDDTAKIGRIRREIARVTTIVAQRADETTAVEAKPAAKPADKTEIKTKTKTKTTKKARKKAKD